jgi:hypothetical protein
LSGEEENVNFMQALLLLFASSPLLGKRGDVGRDDAEMKLDVDRDPKSQSSSIFSLRSFVCMLSMSSISIIIIMEDDDMFSPGTASSPKGGEWTEGGVLSLLSAASQSIIDLDTFFVLPTAEWLSLLTLLLLSVINHSSFTPRQFAKLNAPNSHRVNALSVVQFNAACDVRLVTIRSTTSCGSPDGRGWSR